VTTPRRITGRKRQARNRRLLALSDLCHICGHEGSDAIDHKDPLRPGRGATQGTEDPSNLAPAHHDVACPTCGHKCNREKTNKPFAPIVRRSGSLSRW